MIPAYSGSLILSLSGMTHRTAATIKRPPGGYCSTVSTIARKTRARNSSSVNIFMTNTTKCYSISYIIAKIRMVVPVFYVMGLYFFIIPALCAFMTIAFIDAFSPMSIKIGIALPVWHWFASNSIPAFFATIFCKTPVALLKRLTAILANKHWRGIIDFRAFWRTCLYFSIFWRNKMLIANSAYNSSAFIAYKLFGVCNPKRTTTLHAISNKCISVFHVRIIPRLQRLADMGLEPELVNDE